MGEILASEEGGRAVLALSGDWRVEQAALLKEALAKAFGEFETFDIDVSGLAAADLSIVQVLRAAGIESARHGMGTRLVGLGRELSLTLAGYGLLQGLQEVFLKGESVR